MGEMLFAICPDCGRQMPTVDYNAHMNREHRHQRQFERWPGYDDQSWAERFAELDRRYNQLARQLAGLLATLSNNTKDD